MDQHRTTSSPVLTGPSPRRGDPEESLDSPVPTAPLHVIEDDNDETVTAVHTASDTKDKEEDLEVKQPEQDLKLVDGNSQLLGLEDSHGPRLTTLARACVTGDAEIVEALLLEGKDDVNARGYGGRTALMSASFRGFTEIV
jgi:hypothetical protein